MLIPLTQGKYAIIDDEDYEKIKTRHWQCHKGKYARSSSGSNPKDSIFMHRFVLGLSKDDDISVDHINGDGFDNRKSNLRICSLSENQANSKIHSNNNGKYKGVHWYKRNNKWGVHIRKEGKLFYLGLFDDPEDAAHAYDNAARRLFGEFARTNF